MLEPLSIKKRKVEHCDHIPSNKDKFSSKVNNNWTMNSAGNYKQKIEAFLDNDALINRKLPKELLLRIFSYLDTITLCRCAQVSKQWNCLALDGSNWQKVDLFDFQCVVEGRVVENLSKRCGGFLKQLSLKGCENVEDKTLRVFSENCRNLSRLILVKCKKVTDQTLISLGKNCAMLHHIDTSSCTQISDEGLKQLRDLLHFYDTSEYFVKFTVVSTDDATNSSIKGLIDYVNFNIGTSDGCRFLTHLDISWCDRISDRGIGYIAAKCPKLMYLIAKGITRLTDTSLKNLSNNCPDLIHLNLYKCVNIGDAGMQNIAKGCNNLEFLGLSECCDLRDDTLIALSQYCFSLKTLEVASCTNLTDSGFIKLAKACTELERMDLEECVQVSDKTLHYLSIHCFKLKELTLSHCELITDEGIQDLGSGMCATDHLEVLELDNCPLITDSSLEHLLGCQNLKKLELYDCQLITRGGIRRLKNSLPNIEIHAYFAPNSPSPSIDDDNGRRRRKYCRCCVVL